MRSGIGVGGYCLTKDPPFGNAASKQIGNKLDFPLSNLAVKINQKMTLMYYQKLKIGLKKYREKRYY